MDIESPDKKTGETRNSGELNPAHILIVDDDMSIRQVLEKGLRYAGYDCSVAENADAALKVMEEKKVDVMVTDIVMPEMSGIELTRLVKAKYDCDVIVITGFTEDYNYEEVVENGASDFIEKPVLIGELVLRVKRVLTERVLLDEQKKVTEALRESEEKYRDIFKNVSDFLYFHDLQGYFLETNLAFKTEFGYSEKDLARMNVRDLMPDAYKDQFDDYLKSVAAEGKSEGLMHVLTKAGQERIVEYRNSVVRDATGPVGVRGSARDITERIQMEKALEDSEEQYRAIFEQAADSIMLVDPETGALVDFNERAHASLGYSSEEFKDLKISDFEVIESADDVEGHMKNIIQEGSDTFETKHRTKSGDIRDIQVNSRTILIRGKTFFQSICRDITENKCAEEALRRLSYLDGLLGIANRRYFEKIIDREWKRGARTKEPLSLIMADIDYFKAYNDTYGHLNGDDCLKRIAQVLNNAIKRPADRVARYGGEEFSVVLPNTDAKGIAVVAERMRNNVESLKIGHPKSRVGKIVTISLGGATAIPANDSAPAQLISEADDALYLAKRDGRNRVKMFDS